MIEGVKINLGGTEYTVPPLSLGSLRRLGPQLRAIQGLAPTDIPSDEQIDAIAEVVAEAVRRNYPDVTTADLLDKLDMGNLAVVFPAILAASGMAQTPGGAAAPAASSAGANSTAS